MDQNIHKKLVVLKMKKIKRYLAGLIFTALGSIFLYLEMTSAMDHISHGKRMSLNPTGHNVKLLGMGEMTWMWFTMALVHFFLNDRGCKNCEGGE